MLHLKQNTTNELYLVCDDIITSETAIYLFRFVNSQTQKESLIELENELSTNPRADKFTLILPTDLDLNEGDFRCYVYESTTPGDEDWENMPILATVKAEVKTIFEADSIYETDGTDTVYKEGN